MTSPHPPAAGTPGAARLPLDDAGSLAARLGIDLPPECVPGVRQNAALLDRHWASLRTFATPRA